jgi:hypothetical protein
MNKIVNSKYAAFVAAAFAAVSCSPDKFLDVNIDPTRPITVPPSVQLPTIIVGSGFVVGNTLGRDADLFVQHYAGIGSQPQTEDRYATSIMNGGSIFMGIT